MAGGAVLYAKYIAIGIPGKIPMAIPKMYGIMSLLSLSSDRSSCFASDICPQSNIVAVINPITVTPHIKP